MPTLLTLMKQCAYSLDDLGDHVVEAAGSTFVDITNLDNDTPNASDQRYNDVFVYIGSGAAVNQARAVRPAGYAASNHRLTIARDWVTVPAAGQVVLLSRLFPMIPGVQGERVDYRTLINKGLSKIHRVRRIVTSATISREHSLATWRGWLLRPEQIVDVLEPSPVSGGRLVSAKWRGPRINLNADTPNIELKAPFSTAASLTVVARAPMQTWIATASTWAETSTSTGLINPSDESMLSERDTVKAFLVEAYEALKNREPGQGWEDAYTMALADARATVEGYEWPGQPAAAPATAEAA